MEILQILVMCVGNIMQHEDSSKFYPGCQRFFLFSWRSRDRSELKKNLEFGQKYSAPHFISTLFSVFGIVVKHGLSCFI